MAWYGPRPDGRRTSGRHRATVIEALLPGPAAWWEERGDPPEAALLPLERPAVARAGDKRRREFTTGRHCARRALGRLGLASAPIPVGAGGEPRWPEGIVGSITHCAGYRAAAVARAAEVPALGIDAEPHEPLPPGVLDAVSRPEERARLRRLAAFQPEVCWDRVLFSGKEAVYKAWYPWGRRLLDFVDASLTIAPGPERTLVARLARRGPSEAGRQIQGLAGRWTVDHGLVLTAITELLWDRPGRTPAGW